MLHLIIFFDTLWVFRLYFIYHRLMAEMVYKIVKNVVVNILASKMSVIFPPPYDAFYPSPADSSLIFRFKHKTKLVPICVKLKVITKNYPK